MKRKVFLVLFGMVTIIATILYGPMVFAAAAAAAENMIASINSSVSSVAPPVNANAANGEVRHVGVVTDIARG